jgi:hypothetical protein
MEDLVVGARVKVKGLVSDTQHNGKYGVVTSERLSKDGRVVVKLDIGTEINVKPGNLQLIFMDLGEKEFKVGMAEFLHPDTLEREKNEFLAGLYGEDHTPLAEFGKKTEKKPTSMAAAAAAGPPYQPPPPPYQPPPPSRVWSGPLPSSAQEMAALKPYLEGSKYGGNKSKTRRRQRQRRRQSKRNKMQRKTKNKYSRRRRNAKSKSK